MRTIEINHGKTLFVHDSVADNLAHCNPNRFAKYSLDFVGRTVASKSAGEKMTYEPWETGREVLQRCLNALEAIELPHVGSHVRHIEFNEMDGDELDYDRLRSGQSYWRTSKREESCGPTHVTIFTHCSTSGDVDPESTAWRGAAALALTFFLEAKGYSVELWLVSGTCQNSKTVLTATCIKRGGEMADRDMMINAASAWFYRSLIFNNVRSRQLESFNLDTLSSGIGMPVTPTQDELDLISRDPLRIYSAGVFSMGGAIELMRHELQKLGKAE